MKLKIYQVDSFASEVFKGNPAAVILLDKWLTDGKMQQIACENNLSETAFVVPGGEEFSIRWFTPDIEVDLCGHATLAAAHVLWEHLGYKDNRIEFQSLHSGRLGVERSDKLLSLDFPADQLKKIPVPEFAVKALGVVPSMALKGKDDFLFVFEKEEDISGMMPDFRLLSELGGRGVIVSSRGVEVDFVSRFFAPQTGIDEDPVTGSAHTTLTPYWSGVLNKKHLSARQISNRGGELQCEDRGERVRISGKAVTYMIGEIYL